MTIDSKNHKVRIDKYLWAIRIFKTRSLATKGCDNGNVKLIDGANVKPARSVAIGDVYNVRTDGRKWTIEVVSIIHKRVKYEEAVKHYIDLTSDDDKEYNKRLGTSFLYR